MSWRIKKNLIDRCDAETGGAHFLPGLRRPVAFVYPNVYHLGMSNLGMHILYQLINGRGDCACERYFLPERDLAAEHVADKTALLSVESRRQLADNEFIFVMLSFELDYDNLLTVLDLGNVKLRACDRNDKEPFVIIGGPCATFNPEPLSQVADAFVIGEGEETVQRILDVSGSTKAERLAKLAALPGVYVPAFRPAKCQEQMALNEGKAVQSKVQRQWVKNIDAYPHTSAILTPETEFSNMYIVEVARGCGRHCRFCMAGYCFRRPRVRSLENILADIDRRPPQAERVGLMGAAVSDHPQIKELTAELVKRGVKFSVASLRADTLDAGLAEALSNSGQRTLTVAPEAGSVGLRAAINKGITEEHIYNAMALAAATGMPNIKLYFMIGLPGETDQDIEEMVAMALRIRHKMDDAGCKGELILSVNAFVPKPFTPYQWDGMCEQSALKRRFRLLEKGLHGEKRVKILKESLKESMEQAVLARGDRKVGEALLRAHEQKISLKEILRRQNLDIEKLATQELAEDAVLPWDFLEMGVRKDYLLAERNKSQQGLATIKCFDGCRRCGVCGG